MAVSRRGILGGLFAASLPVAAIAKPEPEAVKQTFLKGMVVPRFRHCTISDPCHSHGWTPAVVVTEYEIFDGERFVPLNSTPGQRVIAELT
jgi:hypothetical protein